MLFFSMWYMFLSIHCRWWHPRKKAWPKLKPPIKDPWSLEDLHARHSPFTCFLKADLMGILIKSGSGVFSAMPAISPGVMEKLKEKRLWIPATSHLASFLIRFIINFPNGCEVFLIPIRPQSVDKSLRSCLSWKGSSFGLEETVVHLELAPCITSWRMQCDPQNWGNDGQMHSLLAVLQSCKVILWPFTGEN